MAQTSFYPEGGIFDIETLKSHFGEHLYVVGQMGSISHFKPIKITSHNEMFSDLPEVESGRERDLVLGYALNEDGSYYALLQEDTHLETTEHMATLGILESEYGRTEHTIFADYEAAVAYAEALKNDPEYVAEVECHHAYMDRLEQRMEEDADWHGLSGDARDVFMLDMLTEELESRKNR